MKLATAIIICFTFIMFSYADVPTPYNKPLIERIKKSENIYRFSLRTGSPLDKIIEINGLKAPFRVFINQPLFIINNKEEFYDIKHSENAVTIPFPKEKPKIEIVKSPYKKPWNIKSRLTLTLPSPAPMTSNRFAWPLQGKIISKFKEKHDGILISAQEHQPIKAAENGVVAFVGDQLKGLGSVILIKHDDNWISAYGKIGKVNVKRGDVLSRGSILGYAQNSKNSQLLFELRHKTEAKNPLLYMN